MSQFGVYKNHNPASKKQFPYLLDIQSDFLNELKTTVVIPLTPARLVEEITLSRLNPEVDINGDRYFIMTQDLAGIACSSLKTKVHDLSHHRSDITAAIDFVLSGI